jgi:hypothetical protein
VSRPGSGSHHQRDGSPGLGQLAWETTWRSTRLKGRLQASGSSFVPYDIGRLPTGPDGNAVSWSSDRVLFPDDGGPHGSRYGTHGPPEISSRSASEATHGGFGELLDSA